jgi:hypothetical protein
MDPFGRGFEAAEIRGMQKALCFFSGFPRCSRFDEFDTGILILSLRLDLFQYSFIQYFEDFWRL